jgi:hypothetical protein
MNRGLKREGNGKTIADESVGYERMDMLYRVFFENQLKHRNQQ